MADKKKSDKKAVKALGTGGANRAGMALINRHKVLEDAINGSYGAEKKARK